MSVSPDVVYPVTAAQHINRAVMLFRGTIVREYRRCTIIEFPTLHAATSWAEFSRELRNTVSLYMGLDGEVKFGEIVTVKFEHTRLEIVQ